MREIYYVRREVVNTTLKQWEILNGKFLIDGVYQLNPKLVAKEVGAIGCLTAQANDHEIEFFEALHEQLRIN